MRINAIDVKPHWLMEYNPASGGFIPGFGSMSIP